MVLNLKVLHIGANLREACGLSESFSSHTYKDVSTKAQSALIIGGVGLGLGLSLQRALRLPMEGSGKIRA